MKKVVRMLGLCALVALAFTSCKKNNETNSVTFKASMVQPTADSRTIGVGSEEAGYWAIWSDNDKIMVVNPAGDDNKDFTLTTRSGQNAVFTVTDPDKVNFLKDLETDTYTAFYPFAELNGNEVTIPINPNQTADELGCTFGINLYPMYGKNTLENGNKFDFVSDAGFLTFTFGSFIGYPIKIDEVVLTANEDIVGNMVYVYDPLTHSYTYNRFDGTTDGDAKTIDFTFDERTVTNGGPAIISFILPPITLTGFTATVKYQGQVVRTFTCNAPKTIEPQVFLMMDRQELMDAPSK